MYSITCTVHSSERLKGEGGGGSDEKEVDWQTRMKTGARSLHDLVLTPTDSSGRHGWFSVAFFLSSRPTLTKWRNSFKKLNTLYQVSSSSCLGSLLTMSSGHAPVHVYLSLMVTALTP